MPKNGETNHTLGLYRNVCCGEEIVVPEGDAFPDCPNHPKLSTIWKPENTQKILRLAPQFTIGDEVKVVGPHRYSGMQGVLVQVTLSSRDGVHRYEVRLSDGSTTKFFGFELQLLRDQSSRSA